MSLFSSLFKPKVELPQSLATRLADWSALEAAREDITLDQANFVVVDVETSGLDPRRDRLLAIGACPLRADKLLVGSSFERILYQKEVSTKENILVHGIAPDEQAGGIPPEQALIEFLEYTGKSVLVAYHAMFDYTVLDRAARAALGVRFPHRWLDLAHLAPALVPEAYLPHASLDDWLYRFNIRVQTRHRAVDDVIATGELMLILLKKAARRRNQTVGTLLAEADAQRQIML